MYTDKNSVIGAYCPDQWEDTRGMKTSYGDSGWKDIKSGSPFLFYWVNDEIQIIKHRDDKISFMCSDKGLLMVIANGLKINADKNELSEAFANNRYWVHPENTGNLKIDGYGNIFFAGGNDMNFKCLDVEAWSLN